jgi:MFS family permease
VAIVLSISSLVLACSKFLVGFSYDKLGLRITVTACDLFACSAFLCLAFVSTAGGNILAMCYGVLASLALPLETVLVPLIAADLFGEKEFAKMLGIFVSLNVTGYALGTPICNLVFEHFGTYAPVLIFFSILMVVIAAVFQFIMNGAAKEHRRAAALEAENK